MNIRTPRSGDHARIIKKFFAESGVNVSHSDALNLTARLHGYKDSHAMLKDPAYQEPLALKSLSSNEFELLGPKQTSVWVNVENISVCIKKDDEGVVVDLYQKDKEDEECLASTWLLYDDATSSCVRCGTALNAEGYCEDETCPHSDWPQSVDVGAIGDMSSSEVESRFNVHKSKGFTVKAVAWETVALQPAITHLRLNHDTFEVARLESSNLTKLAQCPNLESRLRLSQSPGLTYKDEVDVSLSLGQLYKALEFVPGLLDMSNGSVLQLLSKHGDTFQVFSPSLNRFVADS